MTELSVWPTKEQDLQIAEDIMQKHSELNEDMPLSFFEVHLISDEEPDVNLSAWLKELISEYRDRYGYEQAEFVTRMVINQYMLREHTLH